MCRAGDRLGHPFGMTGARIATTLLNNLKTYDKTFGLETCVSRRPGHGDGDRAAVLTFHTLTLRPPRKSASATPGQRKVNASSARHQRVVSAS